MSFSDMMSSGRGPGVIGMVMALVVVLGFGLLFMFAFDEGMQGDDRSIEAVIRDQDKEIKDYEARMDSGRKSLDLAPGRITAAKDVSRLKSESASLQEKITNLTQSVEAAKTAFAKTRESFEGYKDEYRALVRGKAKGTTLDQLKTASGVVYEKVNVRSITPVGMEVIHEGGHTRIPFEELPAEMRDYYQFDASQKDKALAAEEDARKKHDDDVTTATGKAEEAAEIERKKKAALAKQNAATLLATKQSYLNSARDNLRNLQDELVREESKKTGVRKTGSIKSRIAAENRRISELQSEVQSLQSQL